MNNVLTSKFLTTEEFHDAVYELNPSVAVFDCDGTLWSGDAGSGFMNWSIETGLVSREVTDWIDGRYRGYKRGEVSELAICGEMVQLYQGLRESELRRAAKEFFASRIERNIFPEMLELVNELRGRGVAIWAVSSTNDWVIEEGVRGVGRGLPGVLQSAWRGPGKAVLRAVRGAGRAIAAPGHVFRRQARRNEPQQMGDVDPGTGGLPARPGVGPAGAR